MPGHYRIFGIATSTFSPEYLHGLREQTKPIAEFDVPTEGLAQPIDIPVELCTAKINYKIAGVSGACRSCTLTLSASDVELQSAPFSGQEGSTTVAVPKGIDTPRLLPTYKIINARPGTPGFFDPEISVVFEDQTVESDRTIELNVDLVAITGKATMNGDSEFALMKRI